ncbi:MULTISPECIES: polysaccharide deacetylase family protein [unclassified Pedobacter]|uniref:polysaccharide deacetylase family protein n=1 Tax=unclassified Pedobacter TaxID=2628915 RepID=UPI00141DC20D|nr:MULTISPECIES: polysaccharide deacetylase family protein [unclassified Pedobacter]NII80957.1 peptidoglycan/xylan/chitin deacetylase (PgdA/CDA1 family) [Pedobacter sp. SG908]NMN34971.1 peptidoglycan/xylan/chitin deacetylase (PgdA/CDA1 family) [Pedobacter sp. SG918]
MVLLSFDIEEFDMPFEYGKDISFEDQIAISRAGTIAILDILDKYEIKATFFCTVTFAENIPDLIKRITDTGHELASHGYYHSDFKPEHLLQSKLKLEELSSKEITGYRMARMMPVDEKEIERAGYTYNTSINPTYLPGRYNNFNISRTHFIKNNVLQIPASVSPLIRFPLFWLSFHNLPLSIYRILASWTYKKDKYLNIYFHPWEFTDLNDFERFGFPGYVRKNTGRKMIDRMEILISWMKSKNYPFGTFQEFIRTISPN